jgi:hypothetical protein
MKNEQVSNASIKYLKVELNTDFFWNNEVKKQLENVRQNGG